MCWTCFNFEAGLSSPFPLAGACLSVSFIEPDAGVEEISTGVFSHIPLIQFSLLRIAFTMNNLCTGLRTSARAQVKTGLVVHLVELKHLNLFITNGQFLGLVKKAIIIIFDAFTLKQFHTTNILVVCLCFFYLDLLQNHAIVTSRCMHYRTQACMSIFHPRADGPFPLSLPLFFHYR